MYSDYERNTYMYTCVIRSRGAARRPRRDVTRRGVASPQSSAFSKSEGMMRVAFLSTSHIHSLWSSTFSLLIVYDLDLG